MMESLQYAGRRLRAWRLWAGVGVVAAVLIIGGYLQSDGSWPKRWWHMSTGPFAVGSGQSDGEENVER